MQMFKLRFWLVMGLLLGGSGITASALTLSQNGKTDYTIVTPAAPIPAEVTAAKELSDYLKTISGAAFPIAPAGVMPTGKVILVGPSAAAKKLAPDLDFAAMPADEIIIRTVGDTLILAGGRPRGTLYAVYTFLEDQLGCRWWTPTESTIPRCSNLEVGKLNIRYAPQFINRESFYTAINKNPIFAARLKNNGNFQKVPDAYGGHITFAQEFVHSSFPLLPPKKYFAEHPDWYSEIDGKRDATSRERGTQLCWSNPEMRKELIKNALQWAEKHPEATFISISQNDNGRYCRCAKCRALDDAEGTHAATLLQGVNEVADVVAQKYPHLLVETLAYQYTRKAPKTIRPRPNVVIRLCSIECDFLRPLTDKTNASFQKDIADWEKISRQLYIWDYVTNFHQYLLPQPNLDVLGPNLRYFAAHKVIGVFEEGDYGSTIGDFVPLRAWLISKLLWNPQADENALIDEFLQGYYGPAAPHLKAYLQLVQQTALQSGDEIGCFNNHCSWFKPEALRQGWALFDQALDAVKNDPTLTARIKRERASLIAAVLDYRTDEKWYAFWKDRGPKVDSAELAREIIALARQYQCTQYRENGKFEQYQKDLTTRFL